MSRTAALPAMRRAHAHNDYAHDRPFHDAVDRGFTSIEADVWLVDGELLVAHELDEVRPGRTLAALYLEPLAAAVAADPGLSWLLLIDLKSEGVSTYLMVEDALLPYAAILTRFAPDPRPGPVDVVVSGDRPLPTLLARHPRHTGYDGRLPDLLDPSSFPEPARRSGAAVEGPHPPFPEPARRSRAAVEGPSTPAPRLDRSIMPIVSADWARHFTWRGVGPMPTGELGHLERIVALAHGGGQRVRFWNTPDEPGAARDAVWSLLLELGVDHLNSDDLDGLAAFLQARGAAID